MKRNGVAERNLIKEKSSIAYPNGAQIDMKQHDAANEVFEARFSSTVEVTIISTELSKV